MVITNRFVTSNMRCESGKFIELSENLLNAFDVGLAVVPMRLRPEAIADQLLDIDANGKTALGCVTQ